MFLTTPNTIGGNFRTTNTPIHLTHTPKTPNRQPPHLGEHNTEILCNLAGLTPAELSALAEEGRV